MKIIEAMKKVKDLTRKADDLRNKVGQHCADLDYENPVYGTAKEQAEMVAGWIQAHRDITAEILKLRIAIQKTNLVTSATIVLTDKPVTKTLAEWVHRRRDLAALELSMWKKLGDRGLRDAQIQPSVAGQPPKDVKVRRYYDVRERDAMVLAYTSEPHEIDAALEVVNAVTDVVE